MPILDLATAVEPTNWAAIDVRSGSPDVRTGTESPGGVPDRAPISALRTEQQSVRPPVARGSVVLVIPEVDKALRTLIEREAVGGSDVEVAFDAPTKDWASRRTGPSIDVYLYDIREDLRRRERGLVNEYDGNRVLARHMPPRYFKLSYLVAAWTQRPEDEHGLLSALLSCFLRHDSIPRDLLSGPLAEVGLPVPLSVALPPPEDRSFADVWTALGGELKPSLDVVVTAPIDTGQVHSVGPPVSRPAKLVVEGRGGLPAREVRIGRGVGDDADRRSLGDSVMSRTAVNRSRGPARRRRRASPGDE